MKIIKEMVHTKEVLYYNLTLQVPLWCKWIACDKNGRVVAYQYMPVCDDEHYWIGTHYSDLCFVELEDEDWTDSLVGVK